MLSTVSRRSLFFVAAILFVQDVTFKTETKLVIVDLSARDKSGRPIMNLQKGDVEVYEDGVLQKISIFELQKLSGEPLAPVSFASRTPVTIEEKAPAAKATVAPAVNNPIRFQDRRLLCLFF